MLDKGLSELKRSQPFCLEPMQDKKTSNVPCIRMKILNKKTQIFKMYLRCLLECGHLNERRFC